eukprot:12945827-Alexandrium_andersonii.AAC.1
MTLCPSAPKVWHWAISARLNSEQRDRRARARARLPGEGNLITDPGATHLVSAGETENNASRVCS